MSLHVLDDDGHPLDAHLDLDGGDIIYHSRGGTRGAASARNLDYGRALRLLLERAAKAGHRLHGVWLESDETAALIRNERSILDGDDLSSASADQFRILSRNMQRFGRPADAEYGGSRVKKIRIAGSWPQDAEKVRAILRLGGRGDESEGTMPRFSAREDAAAAVKRKLVDNLGHYDAVNPSQDIFDPSLIEDGRKAIAAMVRRRQGRPAFRRALLRAYGGRCAISGCAVEPLLEAAHIHPYRGPETNAAQNGLLLRADIHTLFDLGLITISSSMTISVSSMLASTEYAALDGSKLQLPLQVGDYPSSLALAWHRAKGSSIISIISGSFQDQS